INGKVQGELVSVWSSVELGPTAEIEGETVAVGKPLKMDPNAKLGRGPIQVPLGNFALRLDSFRRNVLEGVLLRPLPPHVKWAWVIGGCFFALHLLVALLLSQPVQACARTLVAKPVRSLFVGVLVGVL